MDDTKVSRGAIVNFSSPFAKGRGGREEGHCASEPNLGYKTCADTCRTTFAFGSNLTDCVMTIIHDIFAYNNFAYNNSLLNQTPRVTDTAYREICQVSCSFCLPPLSLSALLLRLRVLCLSVDMARVAVQQVARHALFVVLSKTQTRPLMYSSSPFCPAFLVHLSLWRGAYSSVNEVVGRPVCSNRKE